MRDQRSALSGRGQRRDPLRRRGRGHRRSPPLTKVPVYNLVPEDGQPALFGLSLAGNSVYLKADVAWDGDYHEGFVIDVPEPPARGKVLTNRLTFNGRSGDGTFITTPTTCLDPEQAGFEGIYSTFLLAASKEELASGGYVFPQSAEPQFESPLPEGKKPIDCEGVPYEPTVEVEPGEAATDSPSGAVTDVKLPHITGGATRESSHTRRAEVTLPAGMGINPSAANGLVACTDEQFGKGTKNPVACPPASKIGTVDDRDSAAAGRLADRRRLRRPAEEHRPRLGRPLPPLRRRRLRPLRDLRAPDRERQGRPPDRAADRGLRRREARPRSAAGPPQVPFTSFKLDFNDGPRAPLTSPPTCGPHTATTSLTPWTGNPAATPSGDFKLDAAPGGGACAETMAARPFAPGFKAATDNPKGGAFSPFRLHITRAAGEQELKGATVDLPPGLTAKLAGLKYCPESALAAAAANRGQQRGRRLQLPRTRASSAPPPSTPAAASRSRSAARSSSPAPTPGRPLSLAVDHPGDGRAVRPRHRRAAGWR